MARGVISHYMPLMQVNFCLKNSRQQNVRSSDNTISGVIFDFLLTQVQRCIIIQLHCHYISPCSLTVFDKVVTKIRNKLPIHENADVNITCDFGDGDISRSRSRLTHCHIVSSIIVR